MFKKDSFLLVAVVMVGALGTYLLISSQAATPYASVTASQGTLAGSAALQADNSASNGHFVQFGSASAGNGITYGTPQHPFSATSPINTPIPSNPKFSASNGRITGLVGDIYEFGNPTYIATPSAPKSSVSCSEAWGTCPFSGYQIPIPANAVPASG